MPRQMVSVSGHEANVGNAVALPDDTTAWLMFILSRLLPVARALR